MGILDILEGIIIIAFEIIFCNIFLEIFLENKFMKYKPLRYLLLGVLIAGSFGISCFRPNPIIKIIMIVLLISALMNRLYIVSFKKLLMLVSIYFGLLLGIDYLVIIVIKAVLPPETATYLNNPIYGVMVVLLGRVSVFGVIMIIKKNWNKNNSLSLISDSQWLRFLYFPIMSIIALVAMLINFDTEINTRASNTLIIISCGLLIMNVMIFYLMQDIIVREKQIQNDIIFKERMKNETNMYRSMSDNFELQRKRIHEYNNQIECIEGMLIKQKVNEALDYVEKITGGLKKKIDAFDTNHMIINTIINTKFKEAQDKEITMVIKVNDLSMCGIRDEDLVTILSNLLNNAIEACEKISQKRIIWLKFTVENNMTVISVKNTVAETVEIIDEVLITTKENKIEHGLGVKNIKECVDKYKGSYTIKSKDEYFFFGIIIPLKEIFS